MAKIENQIRGQLPSGKNIFIIMGLISLLLSACSPKNELPIPSLMEVTKSMEVDGFVDLGLTLTSYERLQDGTQICVAKGLYKGKEVGFRVRLAPGWKQGKLGDSIITYQSTLDIESLGVTSDDFVSVLAYLYGGSYQPTRMVTSVTFTAISLGGVPSDLKAGPTKIKLFFEPQEENEEAYERHYAEHYLNIDLALNVVEFHEKDPEYRDAMLRVLSGSN